MSVIVPHRRSLGVNFSSRGESEVLVWAPCAESVAIINDQSEERIALHREARGYFSCISAHLKPGDRYWMELNQQRRYPDPASLFQPKGIFGPSEIFNVNAFRWTDADWNNLLLKDYIIYELHIGTFTPAGDLVAAIDKLPYLKQLGITAIEVMPVAEFSGTRNWGYDGVYPYAVHHAYGGPGALQQFVNACHEHGLAVILDVVYNHLGPEGNNLGSFGHYFTDKYRTPWGKAINFDDAGCDEVRKYFLENALMWFRDFHIDALRLDAVHAICDFSSKHFLRELRDEVNALSLQIHRPLYLIAECDLNDPKYLEGESRMGYGMDAQWIDEFHHALRVASGKEPSGYYSDFKEFITLGKSMASAYVYDGQYSAHRQKTFGRPAGDLPGECFIVFSQNHDQIGNSMLGERTSLLVDFDMLKVMAAAVICSPYLPMLFMGEEYGEQRPFQYFINHQDEALVQAVREGRKREFAAFYHHDVDVPDPQSVDTFLNSKLNWDAVNVGRHRVLFEYYQELIRLRKADPILASCSRKNLSSVALELEKCLIVHRRVDTHELVAVFNFSGEHRQITLPAISGMKCLIHSAAERWHGSEKQKPEYTADINVLPKSFLLFSNDHV